MVCECMYCANVRYPYAIYVHELDYVKANVRNVYVWQKVYALNNMRPKEPIGVEVQKAHYPYLDLNGLFVIN